jgi:hypothetical protein
MEPTTLPLLDWNQSDNTWEVFKQALMFLETKKLVTYSTLACSPARVIAWDDWSLSFNELLNRTIRDCGFPIAVCKTEDMYSHTNEFFIINCDADAIMAVLLFQ